MLNPRISLGALRALSALFFYKVINPILVMIVIIMIALYAITFMLTLTFSEWWLLILVVLVPLTVFFLVVGFILHHLLRRLLPRTLDAHERARLNRFTDRAWDVAERARLPYPVLLFLIAKDVLRGRESKFLSKIIGDSRELMKEFEEIQELFRK